MNCPYCGSANVRRGGFLSGGKQRYGCKDCKRWYNEETITAETDGAKILVFDIETSPIKAYVWSLMPNYISPDFIIQDWFVISWAAKWLGKDKVYGEVLTSREALECNDERIVSSFWTLLNEADIVVAHNGNQFDIKKMNARFIINDIVPPMPYKSVDTLSLIRSSFKFTSNKLDYVTKLFGYGGKIKTSFSLWEGCMNGDKKSLSDMLKYNIQDVTELENFYLKVRAWAKSHPNVGLYTKNIQTTPCPVCGDSVNLNYNKVATTPSNSWIPYRCTGCGHVGRTKISTTTMETRSLLAAK